MLVLEKEDELARHQTGHNSGVVHSGIYYPPGSLKATLCKAGAAATKRLAAEAGVPLINCGKLLVATTPREVVLMQALAGGAARNGIAVEQLDAAALREREPAVRGLGALLVAETAVTDYVRLAGVIAAQVQTPGGVVETGVAVTDIRESASSVCVRTTAGERTARRLAACGGLQADRLARMAGVDVDFRIVPFRGEYFRLPPARAGLVRHLIYPIPDPNLPFLGIHLTRTVDGGITVGPNAVLGRSREGYAKTSFDRHDVADTSASRACGRSPGPTPARAPVNCATRCSGGATSPSAAGTAPTSRWTICSPSPQASAPRRCSATAPSCTTSSSGRPLGPCTSATHPRPPPRRPCRSASTSRSDC